MRRDDIITAYREAVLDTDKEAAFKAVNDALLAGQTVCAGGQGRSPRARSDGRLFEAGVGRAFACAEGYASNTRVSPHRTRGRLVSCCGR